MKNKKTLYVCAALLALSVPALALASGTDARILDPKVQCTYPGSPYTTTGTAEYTATLKNTSTTAATYTATLVAIHEGKCLKRAPTPNGAPFGTIGKCEKRDADTENTHTATSTSIDAGKQWNLSITLNPQSDGATFKSAILTVRAAGATAGVSSTTPSSRINCGEETFIH
jgi:hypothetical protein